MTATSTRHRIAVAEPWRAAVHSDSNKADILRACRDDFRVFLDHWHYQNEAGEDVVLGETLWEAQEGFVRAIKESPFVFHLKARRLGASTLATAYDAWVLRFGPRNARVHCFSRIEEDAKEILFGRDGGSGMVYGLRHLPEWMRLPLRARARDIILEAGVDDHRVCVAYPSDADVSAGTRCNHAHIDELARMDFGERLWQAVEPTISPGGTCHVVTTGLGPDNFAGRLWLTSERGGSKFATYFAPATARADRDAAWLERQRATMTEIAFRNEYSETSADSLYGGGAYIFTPSDLDRAGSGVGREAALVGHRYMIGWDLGQQRDASVGVVVDVTASPHQVVKYTWMSGSNYARVGENIEADWREYGKRAGDLLVEANGPGGPVLDHLNVPIAVADAARFNTTKPRKQGMLNNLVLAFEKGSLRYDRVQFAQLDRELRASQWDGHTPDSTMALAIAYSSTAPNTERRRKGRVRGQLGRELTDLFNPGAGNRHPNTPAHWR